MKVSSIVFLGVAALAAGCLDKTDPDKGELESELPPGSPLAGPAEGKADGENLRFTIASESAHPYANNLDKTFTIALASVVPSCSTSARVHFASVRTEAGYDYVHVEGPGGRVQSFDGDHSNVWSEWVPLDAARSLTIRLETDYSVTRDGFRIDAVEIAPTVVCPRIAIRTCSDAQLDTNRSRGTCECQGDMTCVANDAVGFEHVIGGGFAGTVSGNRSVGTAAFAVSYRQGYPDVVTRIGTIDHGRLQTVLRMVQDARLTERADVSEWSNWNETLKVTVGGTTRSFTRAQGTFTPADAAINTAIDGLFSCAADGALTCGAGFGCEEGRCVERGCVCPAVYQPVCGADGRTYSNGCAAACEEAAVRHDGECGIAGDPCGGLGGATCTDANKCRYGTSAFNAPYPDATGTCVARTYCDAPSDCAALPHPAVPGAWTCEAKTCGWRAGQAWQSVTGFRFETPHPYGNRASIYKELYAPAGASKVRLVVNGRFELESGYDFLEVYSWQDAQWKLVKRYTGTVGPSAADELVGRYHYLRLATDVSVTKHGFDVSAQFAN